MNLPPVFVSIFILNVPPFHTATMNGEVINCYRFNDQTYQVTVAGKSIWPLMQNQPQSVEWNDDSGYCEWRWLRR